MTIMMNSVLALAELGAESEGTGFVTVTVSGNSNDSHQCGSNHSEGC